MDLIPEETLLKEFGWEASRKKFIVTYHPETVSMKSAQDQFSAVLNVLEDYSEEQILFTFANSDLGGDEINQMIKQAVDQNSNWLAIESLGSLKYLSCLNSFDLVVGNSSSALIEAPSFEIPAVNIGSRQAGRLAPDNVVSAEFAEKSIRNAMRTALDLSFVKCLNGAGNPYLCEFGSEKLLDFLLSLEKEDFVKKNSWGVG